MTVELTAGPRKKCCLQHNVVVYGDFCNEKKPKSSVGTTKRERRNISENW